MADTPGRKTGHRPAAVSRRPGKCPKPPKGGRPMRKRLAWLVMLSLVVGLAAAGSVSARDRTVTITARLVGAQEGPAAAPDGRAKAPLRVNVAARAGCHD